MSDITENELKVGFKKKAAKTGYQSMIDGADEMTEIVIKEISKKERFIKVDKDAYQKQVLSSGSDTDDITSWKPVGDRICFLDELE